jgi:hypothetical protein
MHWPGRVKTDGSLFSRTILPEIHLLVFGIMGPEE